MITPLCFVSYLQLFQFMMADCQYFCSYYHYRRWTLNIAMKVMTLITKCLHWVTVEWGVMESPFAHLTSELGGATFFLGAGVGKDRCITYSFCLQVAHMMMIVIILMLMEIMETLIYYFMNLVRKGNNLPPNPQPLPPVETKFPAKRLWRWYKGDWSCYDLRGRHIGSCPVVGGSRKLLSFHANMLKHHHQHQYLSKASSSSASILSVKSTSCLNKCRQAGAISIPSQNNQKHIDISRDFGIWLKRRRACSALN